MRKLTERYAGGGVSMTMLGGHWKGRHASPPNPLHVTLLLRNRAALRYFGTRGAVLPPVAEFGGVEAPAIQSHAVESWLLRNCPIAVELNPPAADGR